MSPALSVLAAACWIAAAIGAYALVVRIANAVTLRRQAEHEPPERWPSVSVLVPARDEAVGVVRMLDSVLAQDYPDFEVLVYDDGSTDETPALIAELAVRDARLAIVPSVEKPGGWVGKNWAVHRLSLAASRELLVLADADTVHQPGSLRATVTAFLGEGADVASVHPRQHTGTWGERLLMPLHAWFPFSFLPLRWAYGTGNAALTTAYGSYMLVRRDMYERVGGHEAIRGMSAEDRGICEAVVRAGGQWRVLDGRDLVDHWQPFTFAELWEAFRRVVGSVTDFRLLPGLAIALVLTLVGIFAPVTFVAGVAGGAPLGLLLPAGLASALVFGSIAINDRWMRFPWWVAPLYPVNTALILAVGVDSFVTNGLGRSTWKGSRLEPQKVRWW